MYNKIIVVGRCGRNPEMRYTPQGKAVTDFSVAADYGYGDSKDTNWWKVIAWGKLGETANEYLKKGSLVLVEGEPMLRKWDKADGTKQISPEINATNIRFLTPKAKDGETADSPNAERQDSHVNGETAPASADDGFPF